MCNRRVHFICFILLLSLFPHPQSPHTQPKCTNKWKESRREHLTRNEKKNKSRKLNTEMQSSVISKSRNYCYCSQNIIVIAGAFEASTLNQQCRQSKGVDHWGSESKSRFALKGMEAKWKSFCRNSEDVWRSTTCNQQRKKKTHSN